MISLPNIPAKDSAASSMTAEEREEQLVNRVWGNLRIERPDLTREFVRERFLARKAQLLRDYVADR